MDGKHVEVKGLFACNFEDVALYDYGLFSDKRNCFWLDFNRHVTDKPDLLRALAGKTVTVKGQVNTNRKGHFGSYLATLENIYYIARE